MSNSAVSRRNRYRGLKKRGRIWWIRYHDGNGRRYEESAGVDANGKPITKREALRMLRRREGRLAEGKVVTPEMSKLRFCDAVKEVFSDYKHRKLKTLDHCKFRVRLHLNPFFGRKRMKNIGMRDVRLYVTERRDEGAADATINREIAILKRTFSIAVDEGRLARMPKITMLPEDNAREGFFEADEFAALVSHLPASLRGPTTMAYYCGWRIHSEVLTLEWPQVDRKNKTIRLRPEQSKNGEGRDLPYGLLPAIDSVIEEAAQERQRLIEDARICPFVFNRNGKPIKNIRKAWKTACRKAEIPDLLPHDLRRSAVRNLVRAGVSEKISMAISGHKTRSVFDRYDITDETDVKQALGKLADQENSSIGTISGQSAKSGRISQFDRSSDVAVNS